MAEERISNIRTVRAFATENREIQAYDRQMDNVLAKAKVEALAQAKFYGITGLSGNMIILTVLYYGGSLVTRYGHTKTTTIFDAFSYLGSSNMGASIWKTIKTQRKLEVVSKVQFQMW